MGNEKLHIGLVGLGKMGRPLFQLLNRKGYSLTVLLRSPQRAEESRQALLRRVRAAKTIAQTPSGAQREPGEDWERCHFTHDPSQFQGVDIVVESVSEDFVVKQKLFRILNAVVSEHALMLTNTSSLSITKMTSGLRNPKRFCGLHFFYPLPLIDLVEIVRGESTAQETVDRLISFVVALGKKPVVVRDGPGSVVNAILVHYYAEAAYILEEGLALPSAVDAAARRYFYVGPCESIDTIGIELLLNGLKNAPPPGIPCVLPIRMVPKGLEHLTNEELGGRRGFYYPALLTRLYEEGRFGKSVGRGLFVYEGAKVSDDEPSFYTDSRRVRDVAYRGAKADEDRLAQRLLYSVLNGTLWAVALGFLSPDDADVAVQEVLHMKQGPVTWMRAQGERAVAEAFELLVREEGLRFRVPIRQEVFG